MAEITLNAVGKDYGNGVRAIQNAEITIADGEFVVLVGPSGCGKSTCCGWSQGWRRSPRARLPSAGGW